VLQAAAGLSSHVRIFGDDYPTADGTAVRDYVHVTDLADAHLRALGKLSPGQLDVFNLGNGTGTSVQRIVDRARDVTGRDIPVERAPRRAGDPPVLMADPAKARRALGWQARHSDLDTILQTAWNWLQIMSRRA
ncbi:MAG: GDP-mannose 4,6-dehydratase, partial [Pseudomonadota bacterium]|nr:GDP-mannose 4,6-dehydratase [Pseudomonadota bacterium]